MNDPEDHLKAAHLAMPSASLDHRMQTAFSAAAREEAPNGSVGLWRLIGALAATGLAAALILFLSRPVPPLPGKLSDVAATTYRVVSPGPMDQLLLASRASRRPPPQFVVSVSTPDSDNPPFSATRVSP